MADFYYRETGGGSHRAVGPFETEEEAKKVARYRGLLSVELLRRAGAGFEPVAGANKAGPDKSGPTNGSGGSAA